MLRAVQQIIFIGRHLGQSAYWPVFNVDMAGCAGTTATAQRHKFVEACLASYFHDADPGLSLDLSLAAIARNDCDNAQNLILSR